MDAPDVQAAIVDSLDRPTTGWDIVATTDVDGCWAISLHHPASHGLQIETGTSSATEAVSRARSVLNTSSELSIASAAPTLEHQDLVLEVRTLTTTFNWSANEVRSVAFLLFGQGALSVAEAAWLAGYLGDDAPQRPVSPLGDS